MFIENEMISSGSVCIENNKGKFYSYSLAENIERFEKQIDSAQKKLTAYHSLLSHEQKLQLMNEIDSAKKQIMLLKINKR